MARLILLLLCYAANAQVRVVFTPATVYKFPNVVWNVTACGPPGSGQIVIRGGDLYALLTARNITWLSQSQAAATLQSIPTKSLPARIVQYGGYASALAAFLLSTEIVKASKPYTAALTTASGAINVVLPLATKAEPIIPPDLQSTLLGPFLVIPAGSCTAAIALGGQGTAFEAEIPQ